LAKRLAGGNVASLQAGQRFRRAQGERGVVGRYPVRFQNEQGVPACYRAVETRRINLSQQKAERERVAEGELADTRARRPRRSGGCGS